MICLQTPSFGWSFQDGRQLTSKPAHHKQRVARSSPIFQISGKWPIYGALKPYSVGTIHPWNPITLKFTTTLKSLITNVDNTIQISYLFQALKQGGNTSRLSAKEFGAFVSEFPLTELKKIKNVDDLLPVESATNDSVEAGESMWNPSQARTLVEDLITNETNWGPVSESNENWDIGNIK